MVYDVVERQRIFFLHGSNGGPRLYTFQRTMIIIPSRMTVPLFRSPENNIPPKDMMSFPTLLRNNLADRKWQDNIPELLSLSFSSTDGEEAEWKCLSRF